MIGSNSIASVSITARRRIVVAAVAGADSLRRTYEVVEENRGYIVTPEDRQLSMDEDKRTYLV